MGERIPQMKTAEGALVRVVSGERGVEQGHVRQVLSERKLLFLIGAVQFVNVLDFMMVLPLGPDFARALGFPNSHLGLVAGSYTAAGAIAGMVGALFLDRFDRRHALGVALAGLVLGTAGGGFARGLASLLAARIIAGAFGGPAAALSLAIIGDVVPSERRGRALGAVMGAFTMASVLGIPAGLELARLGGWRLTFFVVAALGAVIAAIVVKLLPPMRGHLQARHAGSLRMGEFLKQPTVILALAATAVMMMAHFAVVANLSAYLQFNLGYPRERLGLLYLVGGAVSFATLRLSGRLVDRLGAAVVAAGGTVFYVVTLFATFISPAHAAPVLALFVGFMVTSSFRMVPMQALSTRVPALNERGRFMSAQSSVQHLAAAAGAVLAARMLGELPGGRLTGMANVAWFAVTLAACVPALLWIVESRVRHRELQEKKAGAPVEPLPLIA